MSFNKLWIFSKPNNHDINPYGLYFWSYSLIAYNFELCSLSQEKSIMQALKGNAWTYLVGLGTLLFVWYKPQ